MKNNTWRSIDKDADKDESGLMSRMPEIYCAINATFDKSTDLSSITRELENLGIEDIQKHSPRYESVVVLSFAAVKNERFWHLDEALAKMFSCLDNKLEAVKSVIKNYGGVIVIDIAFYQYGTYPSMHFDKENMKKIHFLDADISIDAY